MRPVRGWLLSVCACVLLAQSVSIDIVSAQSSKVSKADKAKARKHYERAQGFHDLAKYDQAAAEYLRAYALFPNPEFLFNVGLVYRLKGDYARAVEYYERYLDLAPNGRGAAEARKQVGLLKPRLEATSGTGTASGTDTGTASGTDTGTESGTDTGTAAGTDSGTASGSDSGTASGGDPGHLLADPITDGDSDRPVGRKSGKTLRIAGLAAAGVGVVGLGLGVKFGLEAQRLNNEFADGATYDRDLIDRGEAADRNMIISYSVGAVALIGGGVLYYLGTRRGGASVSTETAVRVTPALSSDSAGVLVWGSF